MRKIGVIALVLGLTVLSADAAIFTTAAQGALGLKLTIQADGSATISNLLTGTALFDGYTISSVSGKLRPSPAKVVDPETEEETHPYNANVWTSIADKMGAGLLGFPNTPRGSYAGFGELQNLPTNLTEGNLSGSGSLYVGESWSIGKPVNMPAVAGDFEFYYSKSSSKGNKFLGVVEVIPEPATMSILVIGGLAALARRRR